MKLILVHGRDQQHKDPKELKKVWVDAINVGLQANNLKLPESLVIDFPYYGDDLYEAVYRPTATTAIARGDFMDLSDDEDQFYFDYLSEIAEEYGISQQELAAENPNLEMSRGAVNSATVHMLAKALDNKLFGKGVLYIKTKDVLHYLKRLEVRELVEDLVRSAFNSSPCVVVAHSMGSIVGYNILLKLKDIDVRHFITVGSPLGVRTIKNLLPIKPLKSPECLSGTWFNARDKKDIVALRSLNQAVFNIKPPVENYEGVYNYVEEQHDIVGYLSDPTVALRIYQAVTGEVIASK